MQVFRRGDSGPAVGEIQAALVHLGLLRMGSDSFDQPTDWAVREFQQNRGLVVDGIVGPETWAALQAARLSLGDRLLSLTHKPYAGDDVSALQERLSELGFNTGRVDGVFGLQTEAGLKAFQREYGLRSDGVCGPATLRALKQLGRLVVGGRPQALRESEVLHRSGAALAGKVVVLDPGHGGADRGASAHGLDEASIAEDLVARLDGRLTAVGVRTVVTRGADGCPTDEARAALANDVNADLVLSLHVDRSDSPHCQGVATYHFGGASGTSSTVGEQLASLVQREVVARTDLLNCRVHAKSWTLLRLTRMPAIRLELGHVSNAGDASRLADPAFRDTVAEAILVAVQRLYLPPDQDPSTGVLRLADLAHL